MVRRVRNETPSVKLGIVLGEAPAGFVSLADLISREPKKRPEDLRKLKIDPTDPAIFQLSGGTTGVPKLIPRTHNDYAYNSRIAVKVCGLRVNRCCCSPCPSRTICRSPAQDCRAIFSTAAGGAFCQHAAGDLFHLIEEHALPM